LININNQQALVTSESCDIDDAYNDKSALQNIEKLAKVIENVNAR